jgi:hypothetical protein
MSKSVDISVPINSTGIPLLIKLVEHHVAARDPYDYIDLLETVNDDAPEIIDTITTNRDVQAMAKVCLKNGDQFQFEKLLRLIKGHNHLFALLEKPIKEYLKTIEDDSCEAIKQLELIALLPPNMVDVIFDSKTIRGLVQTLSTPDDDTVERHPETIIALIKYVLETPHPEEKLYPFDVRQLTQKIMASDMVDTRDPSFSRYEEWLELFEDKKDYYGYEISKGTADFLEKNIGRKLFRYGPLAGVLREHPFALSDTDCSYAFRRLFVPNNTSDSHDLSEKYPHASSARAAIDIFSDLPQFAEAVPLWVKGITEIYLEHGNKYPDWRNISADCTAKLEDAIAHAIDKFQREGQHDKIVKLIKDFPGNNPNYHFYERVNLASVVKDGFGIDLATSTTDTGQELFFLFNYGAQSVHYLTFGNQEPPEISPEDFRAAFANVAGLEKWAQELLMTVEPQRFVPPKATTEERMPA